MITMINKMKKWNWTLFVVIMCVSGAGALGNKGFTSIKQALFISCCIGLPLGLAAAYETRDIE
jgi:hypothetical protein